MTWLGPRRTTTRSLTATRSTPSPAIRSPGPTRPGRGPAPPRRRRAESRGPGRPPGPDPRRRERLEQILAAACRAILERGFPATRIADIARAAGVSTGTVHYYFATKDEVLVAALKW